MTSYLFDYDKNHNYCQLRIKLNFDYPVAMPKFISPYIRSIVGKGLKKIFCEKQIKETCINCCCGYSSLFRGYYDHTRLIPPFTIKTQQLYPRGTFCSKLEFDLLLIGSAAGYSSFFAQTLTQGYIEKEEAKFTLEQIENINGDATIPIYQKGKWRSCQQRELSPIKINKSKENKHRLAITFVTPTAMSVDKKKIISEFEFEIFIKSLLNRYKQILYLYYLQNKNSDVAQKLINYNKIPFGNNQVKIIKSGIKYASNQTYSITQNKDIKLNGITGFILYEGNIEPYIELIKWGEIFQIGKKTSYGLGQYNVQYWKVD